MKSQSYMTRALQARDPRFARILGRLGYGTKEEVAELVVDKVKARPKTEGTAKAKRPKRHRRSTKNKG